MGDPRDDRISELEAELAAMAAQNAEQAGKIAALEVQVAELLEKLNQNSSNSHKVPSSDPPGNRQERRAKAKEKRRKRGGQKGHKGSRRELLPPEQVDDFVEHFPHECENCGKPLSEVHDPHATHFPHECENCGKPLSEVHDPHATRYPYTEVPPIRPHTTEHRRHAVTCPHCSYVTRAPYDDSKIPASPFGPRLMSLMALLTGYYHLSRRKAQSLLADVLGVSVSLGALSNVEARVSDAVEPVVAEVWNRAGEDEVKHADGTSWLQAGVTLCLWTIATKAATVFKIIADGSANTLAPLFGALQGILVSDRATALNFWAMERRQVCWAHLIRRMVSYSERDGPAAAFGKELLDYVGIIFEYWHNYRDDKLSRQQLVCRMAPVRPQVEALLERAVAAGIKGVSGSCANMLAHKEALWTFVDHDGVPPTNNHAERELRAFVLWRRRSFGTQSQRGNLFAERLMTVAATARKQNKDVLAFLTACCEAKADEAPAPSLFEAAAA